MSQLSENENDTTAPALAEEASAGVSAQNAEKKTARASKTAKGDKPKTTRARKPRTTRAKAASKTPAKVTEPGEVPAP